MEISKMLGTPKILQSPLFVRTDSDMESELNDEGFDSDNYDNDNDSIVSEDLSPAQIDKTSSRRGTLYPLEIVDGSQKLPFGGVHRRVTGPSSPDPFSPDYRKKADWDDATKDRWRKEWSFVSDFVEKYESVEHAEYTRPFDQFRVLIQERGLHEQYEEQFVTSPDAATRSCEIMNLLLKEAPDLIGRYAELEMLIRERVKIVEEGGKASWEVEWERRRAAELGPWGTPRVP